MVQIVQSPRGRIHVHMRLAKPQTPTDKTAIQLQVAATDAQIDRLVYELYGLSDEEIRIVEEVTAR